MKVISFNGPNHHSAKLHAVSEVRLQFDGSLVVVADPLHLVHHVGGLVAALPHHRPAGVVLPQVTADLVVAQEAGLSCEGTCGTELELNLLKVKGNFRHLRKSCHLPEHQFRCFFDLIIKMPDHTKGLPAPSSQGRPPSLSGS